MKKIVPCMMLMLALPFAHASGVGLKAEGLQEPASTLIPTPPIPFHPSVDDIMRWDAERLAFDIIARRNFALIENKVEGRVAKLTFKSKDQTCVLTMGYVGALPNQNDPRPELELPKGWMLSAYQCNMAQARPAN